MTSYYCARALWPNWLLVVVVRWECRTVTILPFSVTSSFQSHMRWDRRVMCWWLVVWGNMWLNLRFSVTVLPRLGAGVCWLWLRHWGPRGTQVSFSSFEFPIKWLNVETFRGYFCPSGGNVCHSRHLCPPHSPADEPRRGQTVHCAGGEFVALESSLKKNKLKIKTGENVKSFQQ